MLIGNLLCLLHIAVTDCLINLLMFFDKKISGLLILQILYTITVNLLTKIIQDLIQSSVIRRLVDHFMKCDVCLGKLNKIPLCHCRFKILGRFPQLIQLLIRHTCTGILNRKIFQRHTDFEYVIQIFLRNIGNLCASAGNHHDQAFQFQLTHGFPDRSPADTKTLCKCDFHKSLTRFQLAF